MVCQLCGKKTLLTSHHLVPRSVENDIDGAIYLDATDLRMERRRMAYICKKCHVLIHQAFSNRELAAKYNTIEALAIWYNSEGREDIKVKPPKITHKTKLNKKIIRLIERKLPFRVSK